MFLISDLAILRTQLAKGHYIFRVLPIVRQVFQRLSFTVLFCHGGYDIIPRNVAARNVWPGITFYTSLDITIDLYQAGGTGT
jgi:hypothetical protein